MNYAKTIYQRVKDITVLHFVEFFEIKSDTIAHSTTENDALVYALDDLTD